MNSARTKGSWWAVPVLCCCVVGVLASCRRQAQEVFAVPLRPLPVSTTPIDVTRQGQQRWRGGEPEQKRRPLDLNHASLKQLASVAQRAGLPGSEWRWAGLLAGGRPYRLKRSLLTQGIVTAAQYARLKDWLVVHRRRRRARRSGGRARQVAKAAGGPARVRR